MTRKAGRPATVAATIGAAAALLATFAAKPALGQDTADLILPPSTFSAPAGCPSEEELRVRFDRGDEYTRFDVRIERVSKKLFRGFIRVRRVGESVVSERAFEAQTCGPLVDALAIVASLSIDAEEPDTRPPPKYASGTMDRGPVYELAYFPPPAPPPPPPPSETSVSAGLSTGTRGGVMPRLVVVAGGFVEIRGRRLGSLRFGMFASPSSVVRTSEATGHPSTMHWFGLSAELCPPALGLAGMEWVACGRVGLQRTQSEGSSPDAVRRSAILWATVEIPVRLHATLTRHVFFELEGAPAVSLKRRSLFFYPFESTDFVPPWLGFSATSSIGLTFP